MLKKKIVVAEMKAKKKRMMNNEPNTWENSSEKDTSKPAWVNCYRLANVVFSEECPPAVSNRGKCLTQEEHDLGLNTDQRTFAKVACKLSCISRS
jgi:hypothetical protein